MRYADCYSAAVKAAKDSDLFLELTPDRVLAAAEAGGLEPTGLCYPLNSFENRVYEIELVDRSRVVAKFYRPRRWSRSQILEEHEFLAELAAEEIAVCTVRPFPDGETLKTLDGIHFSLSDRRGGRAPDELDPATARRLGMLIGRIHNVAARRGESKRPRLDAQRYVHAALGWIDGWIASGGRLEARLRSRFWNAARSIAGHADERMTGASVHLVHADLHLGNVLLRDGELRVLDFDDMAIGPAVQDLWLALPGRGDEALQLRAAMLEGYERFRLFDRSSLGLVEVLRGLRMVRYVGWLARRWHDPAFRAGWPHFGGDEYWRQETTDLEGQLAVIERESGAALADLGESTLAASAPPEEAELTNKDFFWDWEGD